MRLVLFICFLSTVLTQEVSSNEPSESNESNEPNGSCVFKGWTSVAICRKDFVERIPGKDTHDQCCLYRSLVDCARENTRKMCGNFTEKVLEKHLLKYKKMIPECGHDNNSSCIWVLYENYISCFVFLVITLFMIIYVLWWFSKQ